MFVLAAMPGDGCRPCHESQVAGFAASAMARSIAPPQPVTASFAHSASGSRVTVESNDGRMRHTVRRRDRAASYDIAYAVGSGKLGRTYLIQRDSRFFESPASYYAKPRLWAASPGYEADTILDFDRPVLPECLGCHTAPPDGSLNLRAISCESCHGPAIGHVAKPSLRNVVNPARQEPRARDSVCEQCHLSGEARIQNPGKKIQDFRAGSALEEIFAVAIPASTRDRRNVASHSEQLALSACAKASAGKLWCATCHDPHRADAQRASGYNNTCHGCHGELSAKHPKSTDCITCHMPKRNAADVPHSVLTDHRIPRRSENDSLAGDASALRLWGNPPEPLSTRALGLASIIVGEKRQSAVMINEGYRLLAERQSTFANDDAVLAALGSVLLRKQRPREAATLFERASRLNPQNPTHFLNLGLALDESGSRPEAISALNRSIDLDPFSETSHAALSDLYSRAGDAAQARIVWLRYGKSWPQSLRRQ